MTVELLKKELLISITPYHSFDSLLAKVIITYSKNEYGCFYKSIKGLKLHPRYEDCFLFFLLLRLNSRFKVQKEERIILSGHNIKEFDDSIKGYSIGIPTECIKCIHYYSDCSENFLISIKSLGYNVKEIQS